MFEILFDTARGILECRVYNTGRSKVRKFLKEFEGRGGLAAVAVEPDAVRALLERAAAAHPADRPLPRAFREWRGQIARAPEGAATPGEMAREALGVSDEVSLQRRAAELVKQGDIGPWPLPQAELTDIANQLDSLATSTLIVSPAQRREQMSAAIDDALPELFAAPFAEQTATRLEETAYVFWKRERDEDARACLAAAAAFRAGDAGGSDTARAMIEATLAPVFEKADAPPEADAGDEDVEAPK
jgi:hypothetical protein